MRSRASIVLASTAFTLIAVPTRTIRAQQTASLDRRDNTAALRDMLARHVTVDVRNGTRQQVIDLAAQSAGVLVQYQSELFAPYKDPITVRLRDVPLETAIDRALAGTSLRVIADGSKRLAIVESEGARPNADSTIGVGIVEGRVVDSAGRAVSQATVSIRGSKLTTVTSTTGTFILQDVPSGTQAMAVRLFGFRPANRTVEVVAGQRATVRITLASVTTVLAGVVTTATGDQTKLALGSDVTSINVDSVMRSAPITSLTDLLATRVPGLTAIRTSGAPGAPSRVRIRGTTSVTRSNDPIVIVDGIRVYAQQSDLRNAGQEATVSSGYAGPSSARYAAPSALDQIDPNSIERIDVFKGPSATAQWGSDAANGVIVITTKRGRAGVTTWSAVASTGIDYTPNFDTRVVTYWGHSFNNASQPCTFVGQCPIADSVVTTHYDDDPRYTALGTGRRQSASATVSGGSDALQYAVTGSGAKTSGLLRLPPIERLRFVRFHGFDAPNWMRRPDRYVTWGANGNMTVQPAPSLRVTGTTSLFNSHQQQSSLNFGAVSRYTDTVSLSPGDCEYCERSNTDELGTTAGATAGWQPTSSLSLSGTAGVDIKSTRSANLLPRGYRQTTTDSVGRYGVHEGNAFTTTGNVWSELQIPNARMKLRAGITAQSQATRDLNLSISDIPDGVETPTDLTRMNGTSVITQATDAVSTYGWFVEPALAAQSLYFIPGFRLDGGSTSGTHGGFGGGGLSGFPKINLAWVASDSRYFPFKSVVSVFKVRTAFGFAGVQPGATDRLRMLQSSTASLDGLTQLSIVRLSALGNTEVRPERTRELEGGFDADLWNGRASMTFTRVRKTRLDALLQVPLAPSVNGGGSVLRNVGVIQNSGTEMTVSLTPIQRSAIGWTIAFNATSSHNVVQRLNQGQDPIQYSDGTRVVQGYPLFGRWTQPIVGYADANHDGKIQSSEVVFGDTLVYAGRPEPRYEANGMSSLSLFGGRITASIGISYSAGLSQQRIFQDGLFAFPDSTLPLGMQAFAAAQTGLVQTVSVLRFNDLSVSYRAPQRFASLLRSKHAMVTVKGSNLGLRTNFRGRDPNVNTNVYGNQVSAGNGLPAPRTWSLELSLGN